MGDFLKKVSSIRTAYFNRASTIALSNGDMLKLAGWMVANDATLNKKASVLLSEFVRNLPPVQDGEKLTPAERRWVKTEIHSRSRVAVVNPAQLEEAILKENNEVKWVKENNIPVVIVTTPIAEEKYVVPCFPVPLHVPEPMKPGQFRLIAAISGLCKMTSSGIERSINEAIAKNCSLTSRLNLDGLNDMIDYMNDCVGKYHIKVKTTLGSGKTISALKELIQAMNEEEYYVLIGLYAHKVLKLDISVVQSKVAIASVFAANQYVVTDRVRKVLQEHQIYPPLLPSVVPAPIRLPALNGLQSLAKILTIPTSLTETPMMAKSVPYVGCPSENFKRIYETVAFAIQVSNPVISHVTSFEMAFFESSLPSVRYIRSNVKSLRLIDSLAQNDTLIEREQIGLADISLLKDRLAKLVQTGHAFVWIGTFFPQFHIVEGVSYYSYRPIYDSRMIATNQAIKKFGARTLVEITPINYGQQLAGAIKFFAESVLMPRVGTDIDLMNNVRPPVAAKPMMRLDKATEETFEVIQDTVVGTAVLEKTRGYTYASERAEHKPQVLDEGAANERQEPRIEDVENEDDEEEVYSSYHLCRTNDHTFAIEKDDEKYDVYEVTLNMKPGQKKVSNVTEKGITVGVGRKYLTLLFANMMEITYDEFSSFFDDKLDEGGNETDDYVEVPPLDDSQI